MRSLRSAALAALGLLTVATAASAADKPATLPVADPPAVLGEAYVAEGVTYVPAGFGVCGIRHRIGGHPYRTPGLG